VTEAIRVLHVDDDPEFTELTAEFIGREFDCLEIVQATDAAEGMDVLEADSIDCIVSDYKLPGRDGIEFLERVREDHPDLPFILFTGKGSEAVASRAISAGATDYFRKGKLSDQYELLANRVENAVSATLDRQRVRSRTQEYRTLVDEAPIPILVCEDETIRYVNAKAVETLGAQSADDLVGMHIEEVLPDEELPEARQRLEQVLTDREPTDTRVFRFTDLDGNSRYARGTIVPVTFESQPATQIVVSDITQQMRHESRAQQQREQIAQLHGVGVELAGCESTDEVYELMVEAAEGILDLDLCIVDSVQNGSIVVEATSTELTEYEEPPVEEAGIAGTAYQTGKSYLIDDSVDHPEAEPVGEFQSSVTVPIGEFGVFQAAAFEPGAFDEQDLELVEILAGHVREALTRLDQQERLREQRDRLQRENERLDEFASIISHDIRNPLNVAQLRVDLAMEECNSEHLDAVARAVDRKQTLTDELLSHARLGEEIGEFQNIDLSTVVEGCWRTVETADATITIAVDAEIRADSNRLQQLLENLFRNAVEHGSTSPDSQARQDAVEHGGEDVTVTVGMLDGEGFYVEDDGMGMSEQVQERAFESGFSTSDGGTGFGLAIVARVAEGHGWNVEVTESESGGARFEFTGVDVVS
jgi:PAS domain S-box-containing protein